MEKESFQLNVAVRRNLLQNLANNVQTDHIVDKVHHKKQHVILNYVD